MRKRIMPEGERPKCPFLDCFHGMGLAGRGICNGGGDWTDPHCAVYENEDNSLEQWRKEEKERDVLIAGNKTDVPKRVS